MARHAQHRVALKQARMRAEAEALAARMIEAARRKVVPISAARAATGAAPADAADRPPERITLAEAEAWAARARRGAWIAYGRGPFADEACDPEVLLLMRRLSDFGFVSLVQRREGPGEFTWLAQRRERSWKDAL